MSQTKVKIALPGAAGKMGQMIAQLVSETEDMVICAATEHQQSPKLGSMLGDITISANPMNLGVGPGGVIIDFTRPEATMSHVDLAVQSQTAIIVGTTGLKAEHEERLAKAAQIIPVVYCANTSVGVSVLSQVIEQVARQLRDDWDIEIVETHHNQKIDAPSGTALALGRAAAKGRDVNLDDVRDSGRDGVTGARRRGDIGFSAMRGGDIAGEHSVIFYGQQESVEITHRANSRVIFAKGALRAARFAVTQPAGLYSMDDVLKS